MRLHTPYKLLESFTHTGIATKYNHCVITSIADEEINKEIVKRINVYDELIQFVRDIAFDSDDRLYTLKAKNLFKEIDNG